MLLLIPSPLTLALGFKLLSIDGGRDDIGVACEDVVDRRGDEMADICTINLQILEPLERTDKTGQYKE